MKRASARPETIDAYIRTCAKDAQPALRDIRDAVRALAPGAQEKISYGIPTFAVGGRNIIHFAAFKAHIGLYPGAAAIESFPAELRRYKTSKGAIQIPLDQKVPLQLLGRLVRFNLKSLPTKVKAAKSRSAPAAVDTRPDLVSRLREALAGTRGVTERKMFGSTGFMVRGHLCLSARAGRIMCRIDPARHDKALARAGCKAVVMRGRPMRGYVYVAAEALTTRRALDYWVRLALDFNKAL